MPKRVRYFLLGCALLASVCLLATVSALASVGPIPGGHYHTFSLGGHLWSIEPHSSKTRLSYDDHILSVPISRWDMILLGLMIPALLCAFAAGVLAWPLLRGGSRKTYPSAKPSDIA